MITVSKQISKHFHSTEFRCKCGCGVIKIDENLVNKLFLVVIDALVMINQKK